MANEIPFLPPPDTETIPFIPPPSGDGSVLRDVGLGAADAIMSLVDLPGTIARVGGAPGPVRNPRTGAMIQPGRSFRETAEDIAGPLPPPETSTGRYIRAASGGAASGALTGAPGGLPGAALGAAQGVASGVASELAGDITEGSPEWLQFGTRVLASLGAAFSVEGAVRQTGKLASAVTGGASKNPMVAKYQAEGITPRLAGDVTERGTIRGIQSGLERYATAEPLRRAAKETVEEVEARASDIARGYGAPNTITGAGSALRQVPEKFYQTMKGEFDTLDTQLATIVPPDTLTKPVNTLSIVQRLRNRFGSDKETAAFFENKDIAALIKRMEADIADNGGLRFGTLQAARSEVGEMMASPNVQVGVSAGKLKQLYGALSEDMKAALPPEALKIFNTQNKLWSAVSDRMRGVLEPLGRATTPENAYNIAFQGGKQGGGRLFSIKRSMDKAGMSQEWDDMVAGVVERMGRKGPDAEFDVMHFFTQFDRLPQNTKTALFSGAGKDGYARSLQNLHDIAKTMRESSKLANTSNTAGSWWLLNILSTTAGGGMAALSGAGATTTLAVAGAVAGATMLPNAASRLLSSPKFTKWLATPVPVDRIPAHLKALNAVILAEPDLADSLKDYQRAAEARLNGEMPQ